MDQQRSTGLFITLFILSFLLFFLDRAGVFSVFRGGIEVFFAPWQKAFHSIATSQPDGPSDSRELALEIEKLRKENEDLRLTLGVAANISEKLILSHVLSSAQYFIIDKGQDDGVREGNTVIFKNVLVGKVTYVSRHASRVLLPYEKESVINAKATKTGARGLVKGNGGHLILQEVTLSETLDVGDTIQTIGDVDEKGLGIRPRLLIGTIEKIHKSDDPLYQEANVTALIEYETLENVFVIP